jgi:hypothetical protein
MLGDCYTMINGSCLCGTVKFEIHSEIYGYKHCHCPVCRKIHGSVFGSSALTEASGFHIVSGEDALRTKPVEPFSIR